MKPASPRLWSALLTTVWPRLRAKAPRLLRNHRLLALRSGVGHHVEDQLSIAIENLIAESNP